MAKIDTLEFTINNQTYKSNINVGKAGVFTCKLNWEVSKALGLDHGNITAPTLHELKNKIIPKYQAFCESKTVVETFISIVYNANGKYFRDKQKRMFRNRDFYNKSSFNDGDLITFDFEVFIKESYSAGTEAWFETQRGQGLINYNQEHLNDPNTWYKSRQTYNVKGVLIPFTLESYNTLLKAREGLRSISEILFNFVNQDTNLISAQLNNGNLLNM